MWLTLISIYELVIYMNYAILFMANIELVNKKQKLNK